MQNKKNTYIGSYDSEEIAAKIYDIMVIKKKGIKAKTNFKYNIYEINKIIKADININSNYILDIISNI